MIRIVLKSIKMDNTIHKITPCVPQVQEVEIGDDKHSLIDRDFGVTHPSDINFYPVPVPTEYIFETSIASNENEMMKTVKQSLSKIRTQDGIAEVNASVDMGLPLETQSNIEGSNNILNNEFTLHSVGLKRINESEVMDRPEIKKSLNMISDEKKIVNLRKNIRDVMDENKLDTNTLVAQREESERLARVAEQQKIIREYQRQAAVNRQFARTQNRVLSLLHNGENVFRISDVAEKSKASVSSSIVSTEGITTSESNDKLIKNTLDNNESNKTTSQLFQSTSTINTMQLTNDIVTIEDSSSDDDCILLSDEEEEAEVEDDPYNSGLHVNDTYNVLDDLGRVVVNIGHPEGEEDIFVASQIAKTIKPHQIGGVRFLFDNIVESTKRFKTSSGFGCILAHSMGLGKTLQIVCFCDIFLRNTSSKTVLCVMPINTLQNWVSEFNMWIPRVSHDPDLVRPRQFDIFVLNDQQKTLSARAKVVLKWSQEGGVLLIGYELFRLLALKLIPTRKRRNNKNSPSENSGTELNKRLMESIHKALIKPGPDLVICDEGHRIKNAHAGISLALKQIRTRRRIVLTGYPLQNNLLEYWCMVDFVRPNYLGTRTEFCNMFERPIQNGQCIDSTPEDIRLMRYRAHVLHSLLVGFVQRRSHIVLQQTLPQKLEYVILTRMTPFQRKLYDTFMNDVVRSKSVPNPLKAFAVCCKIWNHPDVLYNFLKKRETDLDLEVDDSEIVDEVSNSTITNDSITFESKDLQKNPTTYNNLSHSILDVKTHIFSEHNIPRDNLSHSSKVPTQSTITACFSNVEDNATNNSFNDTYLNNCCPSNNAIPQTSENVNAYWMDTNVPYFVYQSVPSNMGVSSKPDYVGIIVKEQGVKLTTDVSNTTSSSEIVDLDTKEIKTVETDIDMGRNIVKPELSELNSITLNEKESANLNEAPINAKTLPYSIHIKRQDSALSSGIEKEPTKSKHDDGIPYEWAIELMKKYEPNLISNSPKIEIFFCILNESVKIGDRVLLFSQSLLTLNLIEKFLQSNYVPTLDVYWTRNISYFRLDGSTSSHEREKLVNEFNSDANIKLFLISTKAGSLGINLVGANRVILYDASWNPCHDAQAVYRIYRYGQKKPCYVYRLVMDKCLEKKIYDRQIKKQGMSDRVVDECNPEAHLFIKDVNNLCHDYDDSDNSKIYPAPLGQPLEGYLDHVIKIIVESQNHYLSKEPFQHESLLVDHKEKKLSQAEKRQAHRGYELEKKATTKQIVASSSNKIQYRIVHNDGSILAKPVASIRPMQTSKMQNVFKTGNMRSTRWIPAEVWQRQGMTAQEMTLPLDVVIPTNSNDKSTIILKAGQRVMVLKSTKGIYMQLDSGKIIAIRTSSKLNEISKVNEIDKGEIIDITSEGESISKSKTSLSKQSKQRIVKNNSTFFSPGTKTEHNYKNHDLQGDVNVFSDNYKCTDSVISKDWANIKSSHQPKSNIVEVDMNYSVKKTDSKTENFNITNINNIKPHISSNSEKVHITLTTPKEKVDSRNIVLPFLKKKSLVTLKSADLICTTSQPICNSLQNSLLFPHRQDNKSNIVHNQLGNDVATNNSYTEFVHNYDDKDHLIISKTAKVMSRDDTSFTTEINTLKSGISIHIQQDKCISQPNKLLLQPKQDTSVLTVKISNSAPIQSITNEIAQYSPSASQKVEQPAISDFSTNLKINEESLQKPMRSKSTEYLPLRGQSPHIGNSDYASPVQLSHYSLLQQHSSSEQHPKLHIYMPHYNMQYAQFNNPLTTSLNNDNQNTKSENDSGNNTLYTNRGTIHNNYPQYYDNMFDSNNMLYSCDYPSQFTDYHPYSSFNHPQYHPSYNTNTYGNIPPTSMASNSYQMHWSPVLNATSISEQCNITHSPAFSQNGDNSNQWHK